VRDYLIVVPVLLNGEGPFEFLLDTGANTTLIDAGLAARLGPQSLDRVSLVTAAGRQSLVRARLQSLTLGGRTLAGVEVLSADLRDLRLVDARIRGVVGWNFLSEFNFLLDLAGRRIEFGGDGTLARRLDGPRHPFEEGEGMPMVGAHFPQRSGDRLRLVLDTGVPRLALYGAKARAGSRARDEGQWVRVSTVAGSRKVLASLVEALQVGDETFRQLPALLMPDEETPETRIEDGLLPLTLFRSVYFDRDNFVIFNPRTRD
jgi:predicted aspartyl protease